MCANSSPANTIGSIPSTWRLAAIHLVAGLETAVAPLFLSFPFGASPDDSAIRQPNSNARSVLGGVRSINMCLNVSCHKHSVKGDSLDQVRCVSIGLPLTSSKLFAVCNAKSPATSIQSTRLGQVRVNWITIDIFQTIRSVQRHVSCHTHSVKPNRLDQLNVNSITIDIIHATTRSKRIHSVQRQVSCHTHSVKLNKN
jgi:hypothetical protein